MQYKMKVILGKLESTQKIQLFEDEDVDEDEAEADEADEAEAEAEDLG